MRIHAIILLCWLMPQVVMPQKILTLKECYDMANKQTALANEKESYNSVWQLRDKNLSKSWLPTIDAGANILYNSEVVDMSGVFAALPIPGVAGAIKPLPHEQYKVTLEINQVIYDGGGGKKAKAIEKADLAVNQQMSEAELYKLRGQINSCYFSLLLIDRQKELLHTYHEQIAKRLKSLQSAVENGVILKSDVDVLTSEMIKIEQQLNENQIRRSSLINVLSSLTGSQVGNDITLILPQSGTETSFEISRPELKVFDLRKDQLKAGMNLLETKRMPKAFGFATLGYGNPPGSNFFRDEFAPYYIIGAGIKWNIFDWNKTKNEKQQLQIQQNILEGRKTDLADNLKRSLELKKAEIDALGSLIEKDDELIALRKRITATASSQYENGTITATDFMNEMSAERQALINFEIHKISLALAKTEFINISGKDIE
jgi:outer membrane protein TolC